MAMTTPQEQAEFDAAWQQDAPDGANALEDAQKAAERMQAKEQDAADYAASWTAG